MRPLQNSLHQFLEIILDKRHITESLISAGASLHKAINPAVVVEPVETPFHLPALAGIPSMLAFRCKDNGMVVLSPRNTRMNVSDKKGLAERVAIISLVRTEAPRESYFNTINGSERQRLVMTVGAGND